MVMQRLRGALVPVVMMGFLACGGVVTVGAQEADDLTALSTRVIELYNQGKHAEAIGLAERALVLAEHLHGSDHIDVGQWLNNLASLYEAQGRHLDAESLYRRALVIAEKVLGPEHPHVATALSNLAGLYRTQARYAEAEPLLTRARRRREGARPRRLRRRRQTDQPGRTLPRPGALCGSRAALPAHRLYFREGAGSRTPRRWHRAQQSGRAVP